MREDISKSGVANQDNLVPDPYPEKFPIFVVVIFIPFKVDLIGRKEKTSLRKVKYDFLFMISSRFLVDVLLIKEPVFFQIRVAKVLDSPDPDS